MSRIGRHWAGLLVIASKARNVLGFYPVGTKLMSLSARPGLQLKEIRNRLGVTTREVEDLSRRIAGEAGNDEFCISNAWLTQLENGDSVPSIYKIFSLSAIYRTRYWDLLRVFNVDVDAIAKYQAELPLQNTHLVDLQMPDPRKAIRFPVRFDRGFSLENTSLISRMVEVWGEVPVALIQSLDVRHCNYGYIGLEDFTMDPILRPGSFVQIDTELNRVQPSPWRTEFDRPIYFVELRKGYACSWCEVGGAQLTLLPHPLSACAVRRFAYPNEAEIIGQVAAVAMRLVRPVEEGGGGSPKLPRRP
jgi:transcriptional regulator with XRE-family HTH domain